MPKKKVSISAIGERIQKLLSDRDLHAKAMQAIEDTLTRIGGLLNVKGSKHAKQTSKGRGVSSKSSTASSAKPRKRKTFKVSGDNSVLAFVKKHPGATTAEIQKQWTKEGRGGKADNSISKLTKAGKLRRSKLKGQGQRGSEYTTKA